ncbi:MULTISPECIES: hypothetical protein [Exiguobacterium]|uniref:hypothetical protein n=1 Tax=Exiguobacterium TaxID=33986 RepID=UPI00047B96AA|nr:MULTISPECIES: hypothetical protein [Exiguobacterium]
MPSQFQILTAIAFTVAVIAGIARHDYWKRKNDYTGSVEVKKRYKRTLRRINGVLVASILFGFVFTFMQPDETVKQTDKVESESSATLEDDNEDTATVDTNLVMDELTPLPKVPAEYTDRYNEVNEVITRTDALLTLIKKNMSECDGPCSDLPLEEIQARFDAMEELITTSRNQLQKASEIVNEMALKDAVELHTQNLFELEEDLQATAYSLETMQLSDTWESWDEPVEYTESTRTKRLYKIQLEDTILQVDSRSEFNDTVAYTQDEMNSAFHITSYIDRMLFDISAAKDFLRTHEPSYVPQSIETIFQIAIKYESDLKYAIENTRDERVTKEYSIALEKTEILLGALQGYEEFTSRYSATQSEQDELITLLSDMESSLTFEKGYIESVISDSPLTYN